MRTGPVGEAAGATRHAPPSSPAVHSDERPVSPYHVWATSALFYTVRAIVDLAALDCANFVVESARAGLCATGATLGLPTDILDHLTITWARNDARKGCA